MVHRLGYGLLLAVLGAGLGSLVGAPPSVLGSRNGALIGAGLGFLTGMTVGQFSYRRFQYGAAAALVGMLIGYVIGEGTPAGARLGVFVGGWLGLTVGAGSVRLP
jgi:hypothetical protein